VSSGPLAVARRRRDGKSKRRPWSACPIYWRTWQHRLVIGRLMPTIAEKVKGIVTEGRHQDHARTRPVISINASQVTPALKSLFDPNVPTGIRCFAVLDGGNSGKILTDDPDCPHWGTVWEADDGTLYRGGTQDRELLARVVTMLRQDGLVALGFRDGDPDVSLFPPDPDAGAACLELDRPIGGSDLSLIWAG